MIYEGGPCGPPGSFVTSNDGAAKKAVVEFVQATTTQGGPSFVPPAERIATFDQDGTLWVEHPMYSQVLYCLDRVPAVVKGRPELKDVEPFKTVLWGNREAIAKLQMKDLEKILVATLTGMSVEQFGAEVKAWLSKAQHPPFKRPYTGLTYQPMLEVIQYLRANGYKTFIVTGADRISCESTPSRFTGFLPSRSLAPPEAPSTAMTRPAVPDEGASAAPERRRPAGRPVAAKQFDGSENRVDVAMRVQVPEWVREKENAGR